MMDELELTEDQRRALDAMRTERNILLTGDAGTGKSFVLDAYLAECESLGKSVIAMAPTGVAALNLRNGSTIHRTLGLKPEFQDPDEPIGPPNAVLKAAEVIVIDEFSMLRIDLFERVARMIRAAEEASGRKQIIFAGDPFQLPPVVTSRDEGAMLERFGQTSGYCFTSPFFRALRFEPQILREVVRQRGDVGLSRMLRLARSGDGRCAGYFNQHALQSKDDAPDDAIWLCPTNRAVAEMNAMRLGQIGSRPHEFVAQCDGEVNASDKATDDKLVLKVGARVMAVANSSDLDYANGSLGTVLCINPDSDKPVTVAFDNGIVASVGYKSWDILRSAVVETGDVGDDGERLKRVRTETVGRFTQIPLRLAWAITIHKAQGKSFDSVCVDARVFTKGQLYVALSRCTTFDGLHVFPRIKPGNLMADETVSSFYESILADQGRRESPVAPLRLLGKNPQAEGEQILSVPSDLLGEVADVLRRNGIEILL